MKFVERITIPGILLHYALTKEMQKLRRVVEIIRADDLPKRFEERIAQKFLYGDFQFSVDEKSTDFLQRGVFSCYEPISKRRTDCRQKGITR